MAERNIRPKHFPECGNCYIATGAILKAKKFTTDSPVTVNCKINRSILTRIPFLNKKSKVSMRSWVLSEKKRTPVGERKTIEKIDKLAKSFNLSESIYHYDVEEVSDRCPGLNRINKLNS